MEIVQARSEHILLVRNLISKCASDLRRKGINQWDEIDPDLDVVATDVDNKSLFVALQKEECVGTICLNEKQEEAYSDVEWLGREPVLVVHRLCIAPSMQEQGIASRIMDFAENYARATGYASIRLDVYMENRSAVRFYEKRDYTVVGQVFFPRRDCPFYCMEKIW